MTKGSWKEVSPTHSWLFGVMVMIPDYESVGCELKYRDFWKRHSLISLILNSKYEKPNCQGFQFQCYLHFSCRIFHETGVDLRIILSMFCDSTVLHGLFPWRCPCLVLQFLLSVDYRVCYQWIPVGNQCRIQDDQNMENQSPRNQCAEFHTETQKQCAEFLTETVCRIPHRNNVQNSTQKQCAEFHTETMCRILHRNIVQNSTQKQCAEFHTETMCRISYRNSVQNSTQKQTLCRIPHRNKHCAEFHTETKNVYKFMET